MESGPYSLSGSKSGPNSDKFNCEALSLVALTTQIIQKPEWVGEVWPWVLMDKISNP